MKIYRMDKKSQELKREKGICKKIRDELAIFHDEKNRKFITKRLNEEINNEIENIAFAVETIGRKMRYVVEYESIYNQSMNDRILLLIKTLRMIYFDYRRGKRDREKDAEEDEYEDEEEKVE